MRPSSNGSLIFALPEVPEPPCSQFGVPCRVLDVAMAQPLLNGSRIVSIVGELIATAMAHHVRVNREAELGRLADGGELLAAGVAPTLRLVRPNVRERSGRQPSGPRPRRGHLGADRRGTGRHLGIGGSGGPASASPAFGTHRQTAGEPNGGDRCQARAGRDVVDRLGREVGEREAVLVGDHAVFPLICRCERLHRFSVAYL